MQSASKRYFLDLKKIDEGNFSLEMLLDDDFLREENKFEITGGDVSVFIKGKRTEDNFHISFELEGELDTLCNRCLTALIVEINDSFEIKATLHDGPTTIDEEDLYKVSRTESILFLDDLLREFTILCLPLAKTHPQGECSENVESFFRSQEVKNEDPRWDMLKEIPLDNEVEEEK